MLSDASDSSLARVDDTAEGVTFESTPYERRIGNETYKIYDTVGLGEGVGGILESPKAIAALIRLMRNTKSGINLLAYVVRGPRITGQHRRNYEMFYKIICEEKVPILLLLTHMDDVKDDKDDRAWWARNSAVLEQKCMRFDGRVCITGKKDRPVQYERSRKAVKSLIESLCPLGPWVHEGTEILWLTKVLKKLYNRFAAIFNLNTILVASETIYRAVLLDSEVAQDAKKAREVANKIQEEVEAEAKALKKKGAGKRRN